ncbi:HNH endonuclease [Myxococcus xanthus]|uniref:HNH endonuclease n=1 Tax=Myxococcus xanthus TaxID=34 RepID=UPI0011288A02|nr:HNH endonuclease [Myxococcus xanthus]
MNVVERFWNKVQKTDGCWLWTAALLRVPGPGNGGYGAFFCQGKSVRAHRFSYELHHRVKLSVSEFVLHSCHNRKCVRPDHLHLGDHAQNMREMALSGRAARGTVRGSRTGSAKLNEQQVRELRSEWETGGFIQEQLAQRYGIDRTSVSRIIHGQSWAHV